MTRFQCGSDVLNDVYCTINVTPMLLNCRGDFGLASAIIDQHYYVPI